MSTLTTADRGIDSVARAVRDVWGFDGLRPLQREAIDARIAGRDSLVVLPTGGGKSLCYQVPPLVQHCTDVVVSPLISLMKDQVDGLHEVGYPAAALYSGMTSAAQCETQRAIRAGEVRLVFVSPERLLSPGTMELFRAIDVRAFAIDEAHCVSHWGHDFRPEYRRLGELRDHFPRATMHAYTATATRRVCDDIVGQLGLREPRRLVGVFDRPNLVLRVLPRDDGYAQVAAILDRHRGEAAIVYCISRKETEALAEYLTSRKTRAAAYHAGLPPAKRHSVQEAFLNETLDVIVATVAFGMGIDRSDVRCVIHVGLPKSVEHYQQESGRAGRDGLPAECVLLYSPLDVRKWERILGNPRDGGATLAPEALAASFELLDHARQYASRAVCRHRFVSEYFGQSLTTDHCAACDVCLGENAADADDTRVAQQILSCVARVQERFGAGHVADVLAGTLSERVRALGHDALSTFGLLRDKPKKQIMSLAYQLVDQGVLERTRDEYPILRLNALSWEVMRGTRAVAFHGRGKTADAPVSVESWEGVDRTLFDELRQLRREIAQHRGVPPFIVLHDAALREMARRRPVSLATLARIPNIGKQKLADYGDALLALIRRHVAERELSGDVFADAPGVAKPRSTKVSASLRRLAHRRICGNGADAT